MTVAVDYEGPSQVQVERALEAIRAEIGAGYVHTQADTVLSAFIDEIIPAVREAELPPAGAARP